MFGRFVPCVSAALIMAAVATEPAASQSSRRASDPSGMVMVLGSSNASLCYEHALYRDTGDGALADCDAAISGPMAPRNRIATYVNRSIVHAQRGELEEALADLEEAVARDPDLAVIQLNFGDVYLRLDRWDEAAAAFTHALDLGVSRRHIAYFGRAIAREELGDVAGAYADYRAAQDNAPNWALPRRELERFQVVPGSAGG